MCIYTVFDLQVEELGAGSKGEDEDEEEDEGAQVLLPNKK